MDMHDSAMGSSEERPEETPAPLPGILVADFFSQGPGYFSRRRYGTSDWLLTFTTGGCGLYALGGRLFRVEPGDVALLQPGAPHDYRTDPAVSRWEFYWAHFLPRPGWAGWLLWNEPAPGLRTVHLANAATRARLAGVFDRLLEGARSLDAWGERLAENALEEVVLLIAREDDRSPARPTDPRIAHVLHLLSSRYQDSFTAPVLAAEVHLSPSRLEHLFKEQVGLPVMQALMRVRLRQSARLLEYSTLGVAEIAAEVGFGSAFYFSRQFRAHFGVSPTAYRRAASRRGPQ
jgi:AraC family transcriptional regulator of arabinose operon